MPYQTYADRAVNCVFIRHSGPIGHGEVAASMEAVLKDLEVCPGLNILRDTGAAALPQTFGAPKSIKDGREQSQNLLGDFQGGRYAWVVGDAQNFALIHRWAASLRLTGNFEIRPFRELPKAMQWLALPEGFEINFPVPAGLDRPAAGPDSLVDGSPF